jgi:hypothetical protein
MSDKDISDLSVDDIVTTDDLQEALDGVEPQVDTDTIAEAIQESDIDLGGGSGEEETEESDDEPDYLRKDEAGEIVDKTVMNRMAHIVNEDCDTPACNRVRESLGIEHDHDDGGEESEESESEGSEGGSDEPDEPEEETDDVPTNAFGEPL